MMIKKSETVMKPQIHLARSSRGRMLLVSLCAALAIAQSALFDGGGSLVPALSAVGAALVTEALIFFREKRLHEMMDCGALVTGLVLALLLPNKLPPVYAALGAVFAVAVVKESFGGLGANWLNPAAGGWLFARVSWPGVFAQALDVRGHDITALGGGAWGEGGLRGMAEAGMAFIARGFERGGFLGESLAAGLFTVPSPGLIADRGVLAFILGLIILGAARGSRFIFPLVFIAFYWTLAVIFPHGPQGQAFGPDGAGALFSGSLLVSAFIMASDPGTGAKSIRGQVLASAAAGALAFLFRVKGGEQCGGVFAVLSINALLPLVRRWEVTLFYHKRETRTGELI